MENSITSRYWFNSQHHSRLRAYFVFMHPSVSDGKTWHASLQMVDRFLKSNRPYTHKLETGIVPDQTATLLYPDRSYQLQARVLEDKKILVFYGPMSSLYFLRCCNRENTAPAYHHSGWRAKKYIWRPECWGRRCWIAPSRQIESAVRRAGPNVWGILVRSFEVF